MGARDPVQPSAFLDNPRAPRGPVPALRVSPEPEDGPDGASAQLSLAEIDDCSVLFRRREEYDPPMPQWMANWLRRVQYNRTRTRCALLRLDVGLMPPDVDDLALLLRHLFREMGVPISDWPTSRGIMR